MSSPSVKVDPVFQDGFELLDGGHGFSLIGLHHGGVADDVGEHDGGQARIRHGRKKGYF